MQKELIPVAERITEFSERDFVKFLEKSEPAIETDREDFWEKFSGALVISDQYDVCVYPNEYPIVKYVCSQKCYGLQPNLRLNSYVKRIAVSFVKNGKKFSLRIGEMEEKVSDNDIIVYYEDNLGDCHFIIQNDIHEFLLKRPKLVVSPEGVLVFFTNKQILATLDCQHYYWINNQEIDINDATTIIDIVVCGNHCKITTIAVEEPDTLPGKEKIQIFFQEEYSLKFDFDFTAHIPICPIISELE